MNKHSEQCPIYFKCPKCGAEHTRGYTNGVDVFRCLRCGYEGKENASIRNPPETPECERFAAAREQRLGLKDFLDWLLKEKKIRLAIYEAMQFGEELIEIPVSHELLIMEYLEIDSVKLENERRVLLEWQQKLSEAAVANVSP